MAAAEEAVSRAGDAVVDMRYFASRDLAPSATCVEAINQADIFVAIVGFRYGATVLDRPELSYCELEYNIASNAQVPRLAFVLGDATEGPAELFIDTEYGTRQSAFRYRVQEELFATQVTTPDELGGRLIESLLTHRGIERRDRGGIQEHELDVYISHNKQQKGIARALARSLTRRGLTVWNDEHNLQPEKNFINELESAIDRSKAVLVVIDSESPPSAWQRYEWNLALSGAWSDEKVLIPVLVDESDAPGVLQAFNSIRYDKRDPVPAIEVLADAIRFGTVEGLTSAEPVDRSALRARLATIDEYTESVTRQRDSDR
jgi:hypothetical protein